MSSDPKSSPTRDVEPLKDVTDVLNWQAPESVDETDVEREAAVAAAAPKDSYDVWRAAKTKSNLFAVVKDLEPTIGSVLASMGGGGNPGLRGKARVVAAKAVQTFDPAAGAALPTWVSQQLRQLSRDIRKSNTDIHVPDGVMMDAYAIHRAESELEDELGREPTVEEVSDRAHLSVKRVADVRRKNRRQSSESAATAGDEVAAVGGISIDHYPEAMDYVYRESDTNDRKLMEYTVGYGGAKVLGSKEIMGRLRLTPTQLTRRKARLSMRIIEVARNLEEV